MPVAYRLFPIAFSLFPFPFRLFPFAFALSPFPFSLFPFAFSLFPFPCCLSPAVVWYNKRTVYRRFYHSKRRYVLWAMVVVLAQAVFFYFWPSLATGLERKAFGPAVLYPLFMPLYFTIGYGIFSRHTGIALLVGAASWWVAPLILAFQGEPQTRNLPALVTDGFVYAAIGFLAARITLFFDRRKSARPK